MWHSFMTAIRTVNVGLIMAAGTGFASVWVRLIHRELVLVVVSVMRMMQVTVMNVIDMPIVFDRGVPATLAMFVVVVFVCMMIV